MTGGEPITVAVGRFEPVVALGLDAVLRGDRGIRVLETDLTQAELEEATVLCRPGVVIVDAPVERAVPDRLRPLTKSDCGVLVLAGDPTPAYGMLVLAVGATCVARSVSPSELLDVVRLVSRGERLFESSGRVCIARRYPDDAPALTKRQRDVLACLSEGKSHKQIAQELHIGHRTVHSHTAQIYRKLKVRTKRDLIGMRIPPKAEPD